MQIGSSSEGLPPPPPLRSRQPRCGVAVVWGILSLTLLLVLWVKAEENQGGREAGFVEESALGGDSEEQVSPLPENEEDEAERGGELEEGDVEEEGDDGVLDEEAEKTVESEGAPDTKGGEAGSDSEEVEPRSDDALLSQLESDLEEKKAAEEALESLPLPEKEGAQEGAQQADSEGVLPVVDAGGTATLVGEVFGPDGEGLAGVVVSIPQLDQTTRANQAGEFTFSDLPAGEFILKFNKLGYQRGERVVVIEGGEKVEVRQSLEEQPVEFDDSEHELDEVEVVGEFVEESAEKDEISIDIGDFTSGKIIAGVSEADFEKADASDAADAVATVAGANIVDGKFAVVRGLADRYVSTTYNGAAIASSVPNRKAVELDLFPTSALTGINVEKTYDAALSGDFGGAAIDIRTKSFPDESFIKVSTEFGYTADLPSEFLSVSNADLGFLGNVEPSFNLNEVLTDGGRFIESTSNPEQQALVQAVGRGLFIESRSLFPETLSPEQPRSFGLSVGKNFQVSENFEAGFLFNLNQGSFDNFNETSRIRPVDVLAPESDNIEQFSRNREWDAYISGGFKAFEQHEVGASFFRKHTGSLDVASVTEIRGPQGTEGFGLVAGVTAGDESQLQRIRDNFGSFAELTGSSFGQESIERDLEIFQLRGSHEFGERGPRATWSFTDSDAREFRENSFVQFGVLDFGSPALLDAVNFEASNNVEAVIADLENPGLFVGVVVPEFTSSQDAVTGLSSILDGLSVANLSPELSFPPSFTPERILSLLVLGRRSDLAEAQDLLGGLNPEREDEISFSVRTLSADPGQGLPIIRGIQSVDEAVQSGRFDIVLPFYFSEDDEKRGFEILLGGSQIESERTTVGLSAQLLLETTDGSLDLTPGSLTVAQLALLSDAFEQNGEEGFNEVLSDLITGGRTQAAQILDASTGPLDTIFDNRIAGNSFTTRDISSFYVGGHTFWDQHFLRAGLRFESEERAGEIRDPQPDAGVSFDGFSANEVLPFVTLGTSVFDDKVSLLAAWSRTVARPTFFEFVPIVSQDFSSNTIRQGNADVVNTSITNFDLSASIRFAEASAFRTSLFHKRLQDPIVERRQPEFPSAITFENGESGVISGVEFELDLQEFAPWFINANVTFIDASLQFDGGLGSGESVETQFPFQPSFIANFNLGYESPNNQWGANLVFNYTGAQNTLLPATFESVTQQQEPVFSVDLVARKTFDWGGLGQFKLSAGIKNLVANDREEVFVGGGPSAQSLVGLTAFSERRLRTFFIGGEIEF